MEMFARPVRSILPPRRNSGFLNTVGAQRIRAARHHYRGSLKNPGCRELLRGVSDFSDVGAIKRTFRKLAKHIVRLGYVLS